MYLRTTVYEPPFRASATLLDLPCSLHFCFLVCCSSVLRVFVFGCGCVGCLFLWPMCLCWPASVVLLVSVLAVLVLLSCLLLWQRLPPFPPAPSAVPLCSGPVSYLLVPPSGYLVVSCDGPVAMPCGLECRDASPPPFTASHGNKGFGPVWGSALYTMLRVLFQVLGAPALRYSPSGDPEPPSGHR